MTKALALAATTIRPEDMLRAFVVLGAALALILAGQPLPIFL